MSAIIVASERAASPGAATKRQISKRLDQFALLL